MNHIPTTTIFRLLQIGKLCHEQAHHQKGHAQASTFERKESKGWTEDEIHDTLEVKLKIKKTLKKAFHILLFLTI